MRFKPISPRVLTASYAIALLFIAVLSIASHFMLEYGLHSDEGSAAIVNIAGRQRMLSQRIAGLAAQYRLGDLSARADLLTAVQTFEAAHASLVAVARGNTDGEGAAKLRALYFGDTGSLDTQVRAFAADARRIADLSPNDPALPPLLSELFAEARSPLLKGLENVVSIQQQESERRLSGLVDLQWGILSAVLLALIMEAIVIFRPMIRRIIVYTSELLRLAETDPLTGAANRRAFMERCEAEAARARRFDRPASIMMLDVDRFKSINDTYGHAAGDEVLKALGDEIRKAVRQADVWGRLGGEEFAILLVETALPEAAMIAERMREQLASIAVRFGEQLISFTVSVGVASLKSEAGALETALRLADTLMYQAKTSGRNRVVTAAGA
jgi:diguanylate cyclase (GGDEF)-like protein